MIQQYQKKKIDWRKDILALLLNTIIVSGLFYLLFRLSVLIVSIFFVWTSNIQRGVTWSFYFQSFIVVVFLCNIIFYLLTNRKLKTKEVINITGFIVLVLIFWNDIKYAPRSILLPHLLALLLLVVLPIIGSRIFKESNFWKWVIGTN